MTNGWWASTNNAVVTVLLPSANQVHGMNWLEFFASVIAALAWPLSIVIIFWFLRHPIRELIPLLRRLKFNGLEAEFEKGLRTVKRKVVLTDNEPQKVAEGHLKPLEHYLRLAEVSKRLAIMEAWLEVDAATADAYVRLVEPGMKVFMNPRETARETAEYLRGRDLISEDDYKMYVELSRLRNKAAHEIDNLDINDSIVREYIDLALDVAAKIRALK